MITVQNINREVFESIVDRHYDDVYLYAKNLSRDEDLAKDLVQDVFLKLWKKRSKIKERGLIKSWLFKCVRNKFIDFTRTNKKETFLLETFYVELLNEIILEGQDNLQQKLKIVEKEIEQLPKKCQEVFILSKKEGLNNNEIAEHLNISPKTVEGHLTGAMKTLRKKLYSVKIFALIFVW